MANYTRLRALAKRLIAKNGRNISLIQFPRTPADAAKPWLGPDELSFATGEFSFLNPGDNLQEGETVVVGTITYTFKAAPTEEFDVELDVGGAGTMFNLLAALASHPSVTVDSDGLSIVVTASVIGSVGNSIATTTTAEFAEWEGATLSGGAGVKATVNGVIIEYDVDELDGELVKFGDKRALVAAQAFEESDDPAPPDMEKFDRLQDGSDVWNIERVVVIAPGPSRVLYDVQLRK